MHPSLLLFSLFFSLVHTTPLPRSPLPPDAPYSIPSSTLKNAITCPFGITGLPGGVVLLVHGTGSTGSESWGSGPYVKLLPKVGKKWDVCWVDLPSRSLLDAQLSTEYVAFAISYLATQSSTKKISVIGHSQGAGLNIQSALTFFPSTTLVVENFVALAGDFKGTAEGLLLCNPLMTPTCSPSVWQQTIGSSYLAAQNSPVSGSGATARVRTISIYTILDDVIQPEFPPSIATSRLEGAVMLPLQDLSICGPTHVADHFTMIVDPSAFGLTLSTLNTTPSKPFSGISSLDLTKFDKTYCLYLSSSLADLQPLRQPFLLPPRAEDDPTLDLQSTASAVRSIVLDVLAIGTGPKTPKEPTLQPYICERGFAKKCGKGFGA